MDESKKRKFEEVNQSSDDNSSHCIEKEEKPLVSEEFHHHDLKLSSSSEEKENNEKTSSSFAILYQDRDVVIIDKPPNLRLYASEHYSMDTVEKSAKEQFASMLNDVKSNESIPVNNEKKRKIQRDERKIRFPHRLDMATSGVLCLSMSRESCSCLSASFEDKTSKKFYLALLNGHVNLEALKMSENLRNNVKFIEENGKTTILITSYIGRDDGDSKDDEYDPTGRGYVMKQALEKPIEDLSKYKTKQERQQHQFREGTSEMTILSYGHVEDKPVTKVLLRPLSGRKHQLRLHSLLLGHFIVGDEMYGENAGGFSRLMLHAYSLHIPIDKEYLPEENNKRSISVRTQDPFEKIFKEKEILVENSKLLEILGTRL